MFYIDASPLLWTNPHNLLLIRFEVHSLHSSLSIQIAVDADVELGRLAPQYYDYGTSCGVRTRVTVARIAALRYCEQITNSVVSIAGVILQRNKVRK